MKIVFFKRTRIQIDYISYRFNALINLLKLVFMQKKAIFKNDGAKTHSKRICVAITTLIIEQRKLAIWLNRGTKNNFVPDRF